MAITKDICVLDIRDSTGGFITLRCAFWLAATNAYPSPGLTSSYVNITTDANTSGILAAIQAGTIIEEVYSFQFPVSWIGSANWGIAVEPLLLAYLNARKAYHAGTQGALPDVGAKFAVLHDSASGWSA